MEHLRKHPIRSTKNKPEDITSIYAPRWFIFSYDAGQWYYDTKTEPGGIKRITPSHRKYWHDDFRKDIIKILRAKKVEEMDEPVESTVKFKDPSSDNTVEQKLEYWREQFTNIGDDFCFIIAPIMQFGVSEYYEMIANQNLQASFKKLFDAVKDQETLRDRLNKKFKK